MSLVKQKIRRRATPVTPLQEAIQTGAIPPDSAEILRDLLKLRVATPSNLALETGRLGQGLSEKLEQLEANGWVKSEPIINGVEKKYTTHQVSILNLVSWPAVALNPFIPAETRDGRYFHGINLLDRGKSC